MSGKGYTETGYFYTVEVGGNSSSERKSESNELKVRRAERWLSKARHREGRRGKGWKSWVEVRADVGYMDLV